MTMTLGVGSSTSHCHWPLYRLSLYFICGVWWGQMTCLLSTRLVLLFFNSLLFTTSTGANEVMYIMNSPGGWEGGEMLVDRFHGTGVTLKYLYKEP